VQVRWPDIEPSKGQWRFDLLDKYLTMAESHNTEVLLPLAVTPQWASAQPDVRSGWQQPGLTAEPKDINDWRDYVRKVATHCKGRVHEYEIWNEPNLKQYWIGSPDQLIALTREAHDIIKEIDPTAIIVSPSATTSSGVGWLAEFLGKGGSKYIDVVGYHFYVHPQTPEAMVGLIQRIKQTMSSNGAGDKPLWCTEVGWAEPKPFPSDDLAAAYLARAYILSWAAGVERLYWFSWDDHGWVSIETTLQDSQTLRPAGLAYGVIQQWLSGTTMDWCDRAGDGTWTCQLERDGTPQWIVWNPDGTKTVTLRSLGHAKNIAPLLGEPSALASSTFDAGPIPVLVTSQ
jgi:endo-1,4-beta-mannosidase